MSRPTVLSLRLYGLLARAFPDEFKNAYGAELLQATEDSIEDIWRHHGLTGLARLLLDIAVRLPAEHLAELWQDIRYGLRMLAASPGFTLVALTSLSLGICAATGAFSKLNATVFRNLPHNPSRSPGGTRTPVSTRTICNTANTGNCFRRRLLTLHQCPSA
jgi:hypothetical protein